MKMRKLPVLLLSAAVLSGCSGTGNAQTEAATSQETTTAAETTAAETAGETTTAAATAEDPFATLTLNEYEGLEMTAAILPRNAILPGSTIPVTVVITNTGDKSVFYVQGSGSFSTPQALSLQIDGLQPILPEDHLGIATMDYVTKELKPGDTLNFTMNVKAIEPNGSFNNYTYDLFNEEQTYIGDLDMEAFFDTYSDLTPVKAGTYEGTVSFIYQTPEDAEGANLLGDATGYIQAPITISVTE